MARFKTRRQARYYTLVNKYHFLKSEASELSKIKKHVPPGGGVRQYPPALLALQRSRLAMWANYKQWVGREAWLELSEAELKAGWGDRIRKFYERQRIKRRTDRKTGLSIETLTNWVVRKDIHGNKIPPSPSVWDWYDDVFRRLPEEEQWDTPRTHRTHPSTRQPLKADRRYAAKQLRSDIDFFKAKIKETGDPNGEWSWKLSGAQYRLKQGDY